MRILLVLAAAGCGDVVKAKPDATTTADSRLVDAGGDAGSDAAIDAPTGIPAGAALWLRFDDPPGDGVTDSAGAHLVTCTSCPTLVPGRVGNAYQFTMGNRVDVSVAPDLSPGTAFTLAMWLRNDADNQLVALAACKQAGSNDCTYGMLMENAPDRLPCFYTHGGNHVHAPNGRELGIWHHVAMSWDGANKIGYVDGVAVITGAASGLPDDTAMPLYFGDYGALTYPFRGSIDEAMFYNRVLTPEEIAQLAAGN